MLRAIVLASAVCAVACSGELREIRPVSLETPTLCEVPSPSLALALGEPLAQALGQLDDDAASRVKVLADVNAGCTAEALGVVDALVGEDEPRALMILRTHAARLGADFVLETRRALDGGMPRLVGTAARCRDARSQRPYDVLEQIDVVGATGGTDAAFATLRARAWDLHADLVLDVRLQEDRGETTHVTGTAIRYR